MEHPLNRDTRCTSEGNVIPTLSYCDQPYVVKANDGAWVCLVTTGAGEEGEPGQIVVSMRSTDQGITWEAPVPLEPADGPEASYAVTLKCPTGRIYAFYNHNTDRVSEIVREDEGTYSRVDSLGHYVFKFSDDHGKSWSAERHEIPIRPVELDRENPYGGDPIRFFWNVGRPIIAKNGSVYLPHSKVGAMGIGFYARSEGVFLHSPNILTEPDPTKINWSTLPDGEIGLRPPPECGRVAEEHTIVELSDQSLYSVYRTISGYPACAYSRDGGHHWSAPIRKPYNPEEPEAKRFKNPRAANFAWKTKSGRFLYWFHNHGGTPQDGLSKDWIAEEAYKNRNPAWISAGHEVDAADGSGKIIVWSEPEILLYDDEPAARLSYPDLIEENGKFWVTETQKTIARSHEIDASLLSTLFNQHTRNTFTEDESLLFYAPKPESSIQMPELPFFRYQHLGGDHPSEDTRFGFTLDFELNLSPTDQPKILMDTFDARNRGIQLIQLKDQRLELRLSDAVQTSITHSDPIETGHHQISLIVDAGPRIVMAVVDGYLQDGGDQRQFGWSRFSPTLNHCNGQMEAAVSSNIRELRIYKRALLVTEAVGHARAAGKRL